MRQTPREELSLAYGVNNLFVLHWQSLGPPTIVSSPHESNIMKLSLGLGKIVIPRGWLLGGCGWRSIYTVLGCKKPEKGIKFYAKNEKKWSGCLQL